MKILRIVIWGLILAVNMPTASADRRVESVTARVFAAENLPVLVKDRMEKSVETVAAQLLQGNKIEELHRVKKSKESVIHEVFDKVLIGYTVAEVTISPGENTTVYVRLWPWQDVIKRTELNIAVEGMPPEISAMALEDLSGAPAVFDGALTGLPLAATDWTNGALKKQWQEFMATKLPEFRADFDLEPGEITRINMTIYPRLPVIRTMELSMRSNTLPNMAMLDFRENFSAKTDLLIGVPVGFAERHRKKIENWLVKELDGNDDLRKLAVKSTVEFVPAENAQVISHSDSKRYKIRLSGQADVGRNGDDALMLRAHFGRRLSAVDEIFLQTDVYPRSITWHWELGYERELGKNTVANLRYDFSRHNVNVALAQKFARDWGLRYEYRFGEKNGEAGIFYRLHDFLQVEYIVDRYDNWLRLIGNF